jgi:histidinol-phosphate aminotransferase
VPDWSNLLRTELAELSSYVPADPPGIHVRLDANEAPANPSARVRDVVARAFERTPLERYPDARMRDLKACIAERTRARPDELLIGTGSDEVIGILLSAMARARAKAAQPTVVLPTPTFGMYRVTARVHGHKPVEVPLDARWDLDVGAMARAVEVARPNVVFVASPNNPTGNRMSDDRVAAVLEAARDALVVVDEAYVDFAGESLRTWRSRFPNLAILRTLSKVGLAALRIGWIEADEGLVRQLDKARQPFNVSATSQAAAAAVIADAWDDVRDHVDEIVRERNRVASALRDLAGVDVAPSHANFLWIATPRPASQVFESLVGRGILVRSFHASGGRLANRLRVTIGTTADNDRFIEALREAVAS